LRVVQVPERRETVVQDPDRRVLTRGSSSHTKSKMAVHTWKILWIYSLVFALPVAGLTDSGEVRAQQNVPSWAESQDTRRTSSQNRGGFRTRAPNDQCTSGSCQDGFSCVEGNNGALQCKRNGSSGGGGSTVGGSWAPFWNVTMIVLGIGFSVYHLNRRGSSQFRD